MNSEQFMKNFDKKVLILRNYEWVLNLYEILVKNWSRYRKSKNRPEYFMNSRQIYGRFRLKFFNRLGLSDRY